MTQQTDHTKCVTISHVVCYALRCASYALTFCSQVFSASTIWHSLVAQWLEHCTCKSVVYPPTCSQPKEGRWALCLHSSCGMTLLYLYKVTCHSETKLNLTTIKIHKSCECHECFKAVSMLDISHTSQWDGKCPNCPFAWSKLMHGSLCPHKFKYKWHFDRFIRFSKAHACYQQTYKPHHVCNNRPHPAVQCGLMISNPALTNLADLETDGFQARSGNVCLVGKLRQTTDRPANKTHTKCHAY